MLAAAAVICSALLTGAGAAAEPHAPGTAHGAAAGGTWGTAEQVPGSKALNKSGHAGIDSVSCPAAGDCTAGGFYASGVSDRIPVDQAMVVAETGGTWGTAEEVPGSAALNAGGSAQISALSCPAVGDCAAGGYYTDASALQQPFVVSEANGTWGTAEEVPGIAALDQAIPGAELLSLSCPAVGDCAAAGFYTDAAGLQQAFVVSEANGTWGSAEEVPGSAGLNAGGYAGIQSVSCPAVGDCVAGGFYASSSIDGIPAVQAMVVAENGGTWGTAEEVPGTAALNAGGFAQVNSVSCASPGNCGAGGSYTNGTPATEAFVVSETGGSWGTAKEVRGTGTLNKRRLAQVNSVSCASPGNCAAGGFYTDASFDSQAFVVSQTSGTWGIAQEIPGTAALDQGSPGAAAVAVSCGAAGDCSAGGYYSDAASLRQAFVVSEASGTWGTAEEVPGSAALNLGGNAATESVSCVPGGNCGAGGFYTTSHPSQQAFVVSESGGT
jgi:hypothetical protein